MDPNEIAVALARIEGGIGAVRLELGGKLDLLNAQAATLASRSDDHELRLREHSREMAELKANEIAELKSRQYVTPKQLASWLTLGLATVGTAGPFILFSLR